MTLVVGARWTALVAVVAVGSVGCGSGSSGKDVKQVAIAISGKSGDIGWSQQGARGLRQAASKLHVRAKVADGLGEGDPAPELRRLSDGGAQLVIAHGRHYAASAAKVADDTGVPELVFGSPGRLKPNRVGDIEVATEEGGYIAGYISARASWVRSVGIVLAGDDPAWYRTAGGFIAGARAFDPHINIRYAHIPGASEDDVGSSLNAAEAMIARGDTPTTGGMAIPFHHGAQMVLGLGERSTLGVMRATMRAQQGLGRPKFDSMFVDVIGDKAGSGHISITGLTAVMWNFAPAYKQAIRDVRAGTFGKHSYKLDLANGGVSVIANGRTPEDNYRAALRLADKVKHGTVKVPVTTNEAALQALLAQKPS